MAALDLPTVKSTQRKGYDIIPARYILTFLTFCGMCLIFAQRVCLNVAMVAMVNSSAEVELTTDAQDLEQSHCPFPNEVSNVTSNSKMGTYPWTPSIQGIILGSYFYGYVLGQVFGGYLADFLGAKHLFGSSTLLSSIMTCFTPLISALSPKYLIALRVLMGFIHGMNYPSAYSLFAKWAPIQERSTMLSVCVIGTHFGVVMSMSITGYLCEYGFSGGWPSAFYLQGGAGFIWFVLWFFLVFETPSTHPRISAKELNYIRRNTSPLRSEKKRVSVPWLKVISSVPAWAVTIAKFCGAWSFICFQTKLPVYLDEVLHLPIQQNGLVNALLFGALCVSMVLCGKASDFIRSKQYFTVTTIRKSFETIAFLTPACCLMAIPLVRCNTNAVIALLTSAMALYGFCGGGDVSVIVDMAPDFAGHVFGVSNAIASIPGILSPVAAGYFLEGNAGDVHQWAYIFYISVGLYLIGFFTFLVFGSAEIQPWGVLPEKVSEEKLRTISTLETNLNLVVPVITTLEDSELKKNEENDKMSKY